MVCRRRSLLCGEGLDNGNGRFYPSISANKEVAETRPPVGYGCGTCGPVDVELHRGKIREEFYPDYPQLPPPYPQRREKYQPYPGNIFPPTDDRLGELLQWYGRHSRSVVRLPQQHYIAYSTAQQDRP